MSKPQKGHINLIVIGHVNTGQSTISGQLLWKLGGVDQKQFQATEREAIENQKQNLQYAWLLDKLKAERQRLLTIDISLERFETPTYIFTLMDAPGHRDYIQNMISGTTAADVAILVVSSPTTEYDEGFSSSGKLGGGLTREHALLAFTLGVKQMIVCINKMDEKSVDWSEQRYEQVRLEMSQFLRKTGYHTDSMPFIPTCGYSGDNLFQLSSNSPWYKGQTLLQALESVTEPKRPQQKPLRLPVQDVYQIGGIGTVAVGKVSTGILQKDTIVWFSPANVHAEVRTIETHKEFLQEAVPGDNVGFNVKNISTNDIHRGDVASDAKNDPACEVKSFTAQIVILNHPGRIGKGYTPIVDCHTSHVPCQFSEILYTIDKRTGQKIDPKDVRPPTPQAPQRQPPPKPAAPADDKKDQKKDDQPVKEKQEKVVVEEQKQEGEMEGLTLKQDDAAMVVLEPTKPMCVQVFQDYPSMGRFIIRDLLQIVGVGVIQSVDKKQPKKVI